MKIKVTGMCSMYVLGMDMNCPLCGKLVVSGKKHACEQKHIEPAKFVPRKRKSRRKLATPVELRTNGEK